LKMNLTFTISLSLGNFYTPYDRMYIGDQIGKDIKRLINNRKDVKFISIQGVIDKDELKGIEEKEPVDGMETLTRELRGI